MKSRLTRASGLNDWRIVTNSARHMVSKVLKSLLRTCPTGRCLGPLLGLLLDLTCPSRTRRQTTRSGLSMSHSWLFEVGSLLLICRRSWKVNADKDWRADVSADAGPWRQQWLYAGPGRKFELESGRESDVRQNPHGCQAPCCARSSFESPLTSTRQ